MTSSDVYVECLMKRDTWIYLEFVRIKENKNGMAIRSRFLYTWPPVYSLPRERKRVELVSQYQILIKGGEGVLKNSILIPNSTVGALLQFRWKAGKWAGRAILMTCYPYTFLPTSYGYYLSWCSRPSFVPNSLRPQSTGLFYLSLTVS